jgi:hypothetical protein
MSKHPRTGAAAAPDPAASVSGLPAVLDPSQASDYLRRTWNLSRGPRRLAELRNEGGGPKYHRAGNEVRYTIAALDAFARAALGAPLASTAEEFTRTEQLARTS